MQINSAHRFELDLSDRQRTAVARSAGLSRFAWNWALNYWQQDYLERVKSAKERGQPAVALTKFDLIVAWTKARDTVAPWSREMSSRIPEYAFEALVKAYHAWWAGLREHRHVGPPKFKRKGARHESFRTRGQVTITDQTVILPRLGPLRIKGSTRRMMAQGYEKICSATISEQAGHWFISLTVERVITDPATLTPINVEPLGLDVGLRHSITLSSGEVIESPRPLRHGLRKLRRQQRALARAETARKAKEQIRRAAGELGPTERQEKSKRARRTQATIASTHARITNIRSNWLHNLSNRLTREHPAIGHEGLSLKGLIKRKKGGAFRQGRGWSDLGAGELFRQLAYKGAWRGVAIVVADRFYPSSQLCSNCGEQNRELTLSDQIFVCPTCGLAIDRDHNAAINLRPVAVMPTETLNARGGVVRPSSLGTSEPVRWQIPLNRESSSSGLVT